MMMQKLKNDLAAIENSAGKVWRVVAHDPDYVPGFLSEKTFLENQENIVNHMGPSEELYDVLYGHFVTNKEGALIVDRRHAYQHAYGESYYSK